VELSSGRYTIGSRGPAVERVERRLQELGYYASTVDEVFGADTEEAVKSFQRKKGIRADGVVGGKTLQRLFSTQ
jgi:N-acetylmuramoyl-L-alanine amidase